MTLVLNITNSNGETERLSLSLNGTYAIPEGSVIGVESISGLTDLQWQNGRLTLTFTDGVVVLEGITAEQLEALAPAFGDIQTSALGNNGETDGGGLDLARLFSGASQTGGRSSVNSFEMGIETGLDKTDGGQGQRSITPSAPQQNETQTTTNSAPLAEAISGLVSEKRYRDLVVGALHRRGYRRHAQLLDRHDRNSRPGHPQRRWQILLRNQRRLRKPRSRTDSDRQLHLHGHGFKRGIFHADPRRLQSKARMTRRSA